jgi:hypothetical protein
MVMAENGLSSTVDVRVGPNPIYIIIFVVFVCALLIFIIKTDVLSMFKGRKGLKREDYYREDNNYTEY